jgi:signal recognition particle GTPase
MSGKFDEQQMFEMEKKIKKHETIINAMTEEEKKNPDLLCRLVYLFFFF